MIQIVHVTFNFLCLIKSVNDIEGLIISRILNFRMNTAVFIRSYKGSVTILSINQRWEFYLIIDSASAARFAFDASFQRIITSFWAYYRIDTEFEHS